MTNRYERRVLLGFVRVHILHHASEPGGVYGVWMMEELRRHGYAIGPGTIYPILHEMHGDGMLARHAKTVEGRVRKVYTITPKGQRTLQRLRAFIEALYAEVV
jgi:DNA-binding PadR family transcriptional regulator